MTLHFIVAGDPAQHTGGYRYDARIVAALRARGWAVEVTGLPGRFPDADDTARRALQRTLAALPDGSAVVIDGLALGGLPDVAAAHAGRLRLIALIHHPLADETGLDADRRRALLRSECVALSHMAGIVTSSHFTARRLADHGVGGRPLAVVEPGVDAAPLAAADHAPPRLLCVATVTPRKGHNVLIAALESIADLDWTCDCIGSTTRTPEHAAQVAEQISAAGLDARIRLHGECSDATLADAWLAADLFVLPSHYEGYGMVITEALAHGLPVLTTTGGALADTLPPGTGVAVAPGDAPALAAALRHLIGDTSTRHALRAGARALRPELPDWTVAGDAFATALRNMLAVADQTA
ncbi:glycosyltransferase family 4 protein [Methyloversatilis sp.]|uniref:glycosyltransferase family 4 protein n=1 Tax=Methyloversatilis sp. TaxID=2569862 RepID=UPI00273705CE|nr:glycosyltransferase family 4 protein [Methyloversatilis sp.]MDP2868631.1 glycosyltransferase family 4 protein [Methyloversatilis sp.]MDP3456654.1 glycosyltransferase family 4 protein [Methyloversatilis sp.]